MKAHNKCKYYKKKEGKVQMTLKEKYTIKNGNKSRIKQFIFICSIVVLFFLLYSSFARYEHISEGYAKVELANWKFMLNGQNLTSIQSELPDTITLIPTTNIDENNPSKIKPGQTGYFDIEINPTDTEVSFEYKITIDTSKLPQTLTINSYSINDGEEIELSAEKKINNTVFLEGKNIFTSNDTQKIRCFWSWTGDSTDAEVGTVVVNVELEQYL